MDICSIQEINLSRKKTKAYRFESLSDQLPLEARVLDV